MTVYEIYRNAERKLDRNEITLGEFNKLVEIEVEPVRHGHWIHRHYITGNRDSIEMFVCSECREEFSYDAETGVSITDYNVCPNCGARMDKE